MGKGLRIATPPAGAGAPCMWTGSDDAAAGPLRAELIRNLATRDDDVLVNHSRRALGQTGGGHISPLRAYDQASESCPIKDVNPSRAPWAWVTPGRSDRRDADVRYHAEPGLLLLSDAQRLAGRDSKNCLKRSFGYWVFPSALPRLGKAVEISATHAGLYDDEADDIRGPTTPTIDRHDCPCR